MEADIIIESSAVSTRRADEPVEYYGQLIYQATADYSVRILEAKSGSELIQLSLNNIRGVSYISFDDAAKDSLKKLSDRIGIEILPQIQLAVSGSGSP